MTVKEFEEEYLRMKLEKIRNDKKPENRFWALDLINPKFDERSGFLGVLEDQNKIDDINQKLK